MNTYYVIIDKVVTELKKRFEDNAIEIAKDLALLSAKCINSMRRRKNIPPDAFTCISETYFQFLNKDDILREYNQLVDSNIDINISEKLPNFLHIIFLIHHLKKILVLMNLTMMKLIVLFQ